MIIEKEELEFKERMLELVNSLLHVVTDSECENDTCLYVYVPSDDVVVKEVFKRCGYTEEQFKKEIDNGQIDLNLLGFKYGNWWNSEEGYSYSQ